MTSMASKVKPIPDGYHSVTPYLIIKGAAGALDFYKKAFGATELFRMPTPNGKIGHAEIQIGNSRIMMADEPEGPAANTPDHGSFKGPSTTGKTTVGLCLYVEDVDAIAKQAVAAGAKELMAVKN